MRKFQCSFFVEAILYLLLYNLHDCTFNDTHREKLYFTQISTRMAALLLLTFFICLHIHLIFIYILLSLSKEYRCLKKVIHQMDCKNEWLLISVSLTSKFVLVVLGGDYMIPACRDEISTRPAETDFTL